MNKKSLSVLVGLTALLLAGCKSEITMPVTYSEVFGAPVIKNAQLEIEVPACKEYKSDLESSSVLEAKQKINYVFPNATYLGCKRGSGIDTFAQFQLPFKVGGIGLKDCNVNEICVGSSQNNQFMNVFIGKDIKTKIDELSRSATIYGPKDVKVRLVFKNDTNQALGIDYISLFLSDGKETIPVHNVKNAKFNSGLAAYMTLSDVASASLLRRGVVSVTRFPDRELKEVEAPAKK